MEERRQEQKERSSTQATKEADLRASNIAELEAKIADLEVQVAELEVLLADLEKRATDLSSK